MPTERDHLRKFIKPLEWERGGSISFRAETPVGAYYARLAYDRGRALWARGETGGWRTAGTIEDAKAGAQADYESRILSALDTNALSAALEAAEAAAWQPIETAPDGAEFHVERHGDLIRVRRYDCPFRDVPTGTAVIDNRTGRWWTVTHWRHLPALPKDAGHE